MGVVVLLFTVGFILVGGDIVHKWLDWELWWDHIKVISAQHPDKKDSAKWFLASRELD